MRTKHIEGIVHTCYPEQIFTDDCTPNCAGCKAERLLLTDAEIRDALKLANDQAQEYGDDGKPLPEREVAKAQIKKILAHPARPDQAGKEG
jgi:hypothetical protein